MASNQRSALKIGLNYPWVEFGWDFGEPPKTLTGHLWISLRAQIQSPVTKAGPDTAPWKQNIDDFLACFKCLGVEVVRWFLFADCYNLGRTVWQADNDWKVEDVRLPPRFEDDFGQLLERFRKHDLRIIPVLFSFESFWPGYQVVTFKTPPTNANSLRTGVTPSELKKALTMDPAKWLVTKEVTAAIFPDETGEAGRYKGGRADLVRPATDPRSKRKEIREVVKRLFAVAKGVSTKNGPVVYAWDIVNEPELALAVGPLQKKNPQQPSMVLDQYKNRPDIYPDNRDQAFSQFSQVYETWAPPFSQQDLVSFIQDIASDAADSGFDWTVGFQHFVSLPGTPQGWDLFSQPASEPGRQAQPVRGDLKTRFVPQFHYYGHPDVVPTRPSVGKTAFIFGEFALVDPTGTPRNPNWRKTANEPSVSGLKNRIDLIENAGFEVALAWSARGHEDKESDDRTTWTDDIAKEIARRNGGNFCTACETVSDLNKKIRAKYDELRKKDRDAAAARARQEQFRLQELQRLRRTPTFVRPPGR